MVRRVPSVSNLPMWSVEWHIFWSFTYWFWWAIICCYTFIKCSYCAPISPSVPLSDTTLQSLCHADAVSKDSERIPCLCDASEYPFRPFELQIEQTNADNFMTHFDNTNSLQKDCSLHSLHLHMGSYSWYMLIQSNTFNRWQRNPSWVGSCQVLFAF